MAQFQVALLLFSPKCPKRSTKYFYRGTKWTCVTYEACRRLSDDELPPRHMGSLIHDPVFLPSLLTRRPTVLSKFLPSLSLQEK